MSTTLPAPHSAPVMPNHVVSDGYQSRDQRTAFSVVTYEVPAVEATGVAKFIRATNRRLVAHDALPFSWSAYRVGSCVRFEVVCPELVHEQWRFVAQTKRGEFTRVANGYRQGQLPVPDQDCAHCHTTKCRTNKTYLEHIVTGEVVQVGSECIRLFFETEPVGLLMAWGFVPKVPKLSKHEANALTLAHLYAWLERHYQHVESAGGHTNDLLVEAFDWIYDRLRGLRGKPDWMASTGEVAYRGGVLGALVRQGEAQSGCVAPVDASALHTPMDWATAMEYLGVLRAGVTARRLAQEAERARTVCERYLGPVGSFTPQIGFGFVVTDVLEEPDGRVAHVGTYRVRPEDYRNVPLLRGSCDHLDGIAVKWYLDDQAQRLAPGTYQHEAFPSSIVAHERLADGTAVTVLQIH